MELKRRNIYSEKIHRYLNKGLIIVLTGQRRVGKSYILRQIAMDLSDSNVVYIDKENRQYGSIRNADDLEKYLEGRLSNSQDNYLLIDEVQEIQGWEKILRSLNGIESCQIIITGSNASMLSSELSTMLSGRYVEIHIHSLCYPEFIEFHGLAKGQDSLLSYLKWGGLPHLYKLGLENEELIMTYLTDVSSTIVFKDVVTHSNIRNVTFMENLIAFIGDNVGKNFSATSISNYMKSQKDNVSTSVVLNYISALCDAFIIRKVSRYDIHGKKILETNEKYYFEDLGLRYILSSTTSNLSVVIEKLLENVVYLHLVRKNYKVYIGTFRKAEIDFVCERNGKKMYIQVAYILQNEDTVKREFGNLNDIDDSAEKYVVSLDPVFGNSTMGTVRHIPLVDFLMDFE